MLVVKRFSSKSAMFVLHIIFLVSFVTGAWYNTHYTMGDIPGMMKKPRARLCKRYAALPQRMLWGRLYFRKVESLQRSPCYLRTVHIVPLGSRVPQKCATCSVSVAKKVTSALPGRNSCCYKPLCKMCKWKTAFCVCLHVRVRSLFSFSSSHVILLQEPSAFWLLVWRLVAVSLFIVMWYFCLRGACCSLAFVAFVILQIRCFWFWSWFWEYPSSYVFSHSHPALGPQFSCLLWL